MGWLKVEDKPNIIFSSPKAVRTLIRKKQDRWPPESKLILRPSRS